MEVSKQTQEEEDIMCDGGSSYWVLWRFNGRGVFPHVTKGVLKFWKHTILSKVQSQVMVTLQGRLKW